MTPGAKLDALLAERPLRQRAWIVREIARLAGLQLCTASVGPDTACMGQAVMAFAFPGQPELAVCRVHAEKMQEIAVNMGLSLQALNVRSLR